MSLSHQEQRLGGGDRRGVAGRMDAKWCGARGRTALRCLESSHIITPISDSPGISLVRKAH